MRTPWCPCAEELRIARAELSPALECRNCAKVTDSSTERKARPFVVTTWLLNGERFEVPLLCPFEVAADGGQDCFNRQGEAFAPNK